jgi:DNA-binding response OmpR family regulator
MGCIPKKINVSSVARGSVSMSAKGLRVFVVEDEPMIRMMLMEMLEELGYRVVAEAGDVEEGATFAQSADLDIAILDVNLKGKLITPVAEVIKARGLPIIFATGYGSEGVPEEFRDFPTLEKPFHLDTLAALIDEVVHPRAS